MYKSLILFRHSAPVKIEKTNLKDFFLLSFVVS